MENYESLGVIGEGTYGVVMKARHRETGQVVAIKKFKESDEDEQVRKTSLREVRVLKQLRHDNVITLLEVFRRKGKLHLVFEYVEKTILEVLEKKANGLDDMDVRKYMYQLLRGVEYCHSHNIIHRDIKPENILISKNGALKLCDFGFARTMSIGGKYTDYVATRWYRAPELLVGDVEYGKGVDIWAVGCIFAEISNGIPLFPGESDLDQLAHIMRCFGKITNRMVQIFRRNPLYANVELPPSTICETLDDRFPSVPKSWIAFLKACLKNDPDQRESCSSLMSMPYFSDKNFRNEYENELKMIFEKESRQAGGSVHKKSNSGDGSAPTSYSGDQYAPALPGARPKNDAPSLPNQSSPVPSHPGLGMLWNQYLASATTELPDLSAPKAQPVQQPFFPSTKPPSQGKYNAFTHNNDMMVTNAFPSNSTSTRTSSQQQQQQQQFHMTQTKKQPTLFPTLLSSQGQHPSTPQQPYFNGTLNGTTSKSDAITSQLQYKKKPQKKNVLSTLSLNAFGTGGGSNDQMMLFGHGSGTGSGSQDPRRGSNGTSKW
ncbi:mitogen-activated protein kinase, putative [Bodo saltans]|uniref:cyclin-dependent kinase n=1 Tax=Bodo saltans TaxID=75058 RepID=A0A0S4JM47_BODSA|nr:mitogen-activated protein kinase, putative [Bodo saltans]|eukprot:CUG91203.1 mitogen-activated protein kinase, putative [Bodo saltans]